MSKLIYNGIELKLIKTNLIAREMVFSPDGADSIYTRWTIDVDCVYNPGATAYTLPSGGDDGEDDGTAPAPVVTKGTLPVATDLAIREALREPRQALTFDINGVVLLQSPQAGASVDALDGPKPLRCDIRRIDATKTMLVSYRIETHVAECDTAEDAATDPLLSNRYEVSQTTALDRLTTITYAGVACFRMDALGMTATGNADQFRNRCLPPIPNNFQRQQIDIRVSSVGDKLMWRVVDQELPYSLGATNPYGVLSFEGTYTTSNSPIDAAGTPSLYDMVAIDIRARGDRNAARLNLILFCLTLATERIGIKAKPQLNTDAMVKQLQIVEHLEAPVVDLRVVAQLPPPQQGVVGFAGVDGRRLGVDVFKTLANDGTNPQMPNDSNTRGTYTGLAFAAALQAACTRIEPVKYAPGSLQGSSGSNPTQTYIPPTVNTSVGQLPSTSNGYSTSTNSGTEGPGVYTDYRVKATFHTDGGRVQCPVAGKPGARPAILQVHSGGTKIRYDWTVERNGSPPNIPDPDHNDSRLILADQKIAVNERYIAPDGVSSVFRVAGEYQYFWDADGDVDLNVNFPAVPWTACTYGDAYLGDGSYVHGIIDPPTYQDYGNEPDDGGGDGTGYYAGLSPDGTGDQQGVNESASGSSFDDSIPGLPYTPVDPNY